MGDAGVEVAWQHRGQIERAKRTLVARGSPRWGQGRLCRRHLHHHGEQSNKRG